VVWCGVAQIRYFFSWQKGTCSGRKFDLHLATFKIEIEVVGGSIPREVVPGKEIQQQSLRDSSSIQT
jgi:hypothetical protein